MIWACVLANACCSVLGSVPERASCPLPPGPSRSSGEFTSSGRMMACSKIPSPFSISPSSIGVAPERASPFLNFSNLARSSWPMAKRTMKKMSSEVIMSE